MSEITEEDVRNAAKEIEAKASEHITEYAAGMRAARLIMEDELLG